MTSYEEDPTLRQFLDRFNRTGLCQCGCGQLTDVATRTRLSQGWLKGHPKPFIPGHKAAYLPLERHVVDEVTGCWIWQGATFGQGYGSVRSRLKSGPRLIPAHRAYYEKYRGSIPKGMELDHLCRNRLCVNPDHLEPVKRAENIRRGRATKLTPEQVQEIRALKGKEHYKIIAERYNVYPTYIHMIWRKESWSDLLDSTMSS